MEMSRQEGWLPRAGSWEEAVLTWQEQVERVFRHQRPLGPEAPGATRAERSQPQPSPTRRPRPPRE